MPNTTWGKDYFITERTDTQTNQTVKVISNRFRVQIFVFQPYSTSLVSVEEQNLPPKMSHVDYFELKTINTQKIEEETLTFPITAPKIV